MADVDKITVATRHNDAKRNRNNVNTARAFYIETNFWWQFNDIFKGVYNLLVNSLFDDDNNY